MLLFLLVNIIMFGVWMFIIYGYKNNKTDALLTVLLLNLAQIIVSTLFLGMIVQRLNRWTLFYTNIALSLSMFTVFIFIRVWSRDDFILTIKSRVKEQLSEVLTKKPLYIMCILMAAMVSLLYHIFVGVIFPEYYYDAVAYHLPFIGYSISTETITNFDNIILYTNCYPKNPEIIFLWNTIFIEKDFLNNIGQVYFLMMGILATAGIIRMYVEDKRYQYLSLLIVAFPVVAAQAKSCYTDIAVSSLLVVSIFYLLEVIKKYNYLHFTLFLISVSILLGSHFRSILYTVILLGIFCAYIIINYLRTYKLPRDWEFLKIFGIGHKQNLFTWELKKINYTKLILISLACILLMGMPFYLKNLYFYGDPTYPKSLKIFGRTIFEGNIYLEEGFGLLFGEFNLYNAFLTWLEKFTLTHNFNNYSVDSSKGYGPLFICVIIPAALLYGIYSLINFFKRDYKEHVFLSILFWLLFIITPGNWTARYVIFIFSYGTIALALFIDRIGGIKNRAFIVLTMILIMFNFYISLSHYEYNPQKIKAVFKDFRIINNDEFGVRGADYSIINNFIGSYFINKYQNKTFTIVGIGDSYELWSNDFSMKNKIYKVKEGQDLSQDKQGDFLIVENKNLNPEWYKYYSTESIAKDFNLRFMKKRLNEKNFNIGSTGKKIENNDIVIESASWALGDVSNIVIDGKISYTGTRGINMAVLEEESKEYIYENFDTFSSIEESTRFANYINSLKDGTIVFLSVRDEASRCFTEEAYEAIKSLGGEVDLSKKYRWSYILVGVKGANPGEAIEKYSPTKMVTVTFPHD